MFLLLDDVAKVLPVRAGGEHLDMRECRFLRLVHAGAGLARTGLGLRVLVLGFRVWGFGFRV